MKKVREVKIYTIISTRADERMEADPPSPEAKRSFLSLGKARRELNRLVALKKPELDYRYDYEH